MESIDNMNAVQSHLYKFIQCNDEADKAALVERMAALKRKHLLEEKDEELKREKEQLALETELAEANAKLGMNSYLEKHAVQRSGADESGERGNILNNSLHETKAAAVRPKQAATTQFNTRPVTVRPADVQPMPVVHNAQQTTDNESQLNLTWSNSQ